MSILEVKHPDLHDLIAPDSQIERVAGGLAFTEGPVWCGDCLFFSDIPNRRIVRWRSLPEGPELTTFAKGMYPNGLTLDRQGRVLAADGRRVTRVEADGTRTILVDKFQGKRLNSPNDIVARSDGSVYFTDPPFGIQPAKAGSSMSRPAGWWGLPLPGKQLSCNGVYRIAPDGILHLVADDCALPNGLAFSPDESVLYVDDSAHKHIRAYDMHADGTLTNSRILLDMASEDPGVPDGLKVDLQGNIFCTGPGGIWVCRSDGELLGRIIAPELPANLAWGEDGSALFLTARTSVYRLRTRTRGMLLR